MRRFSLAFPIASLVAASVSVTIPAAAFAQTAGQANTKKTTSIIPRTPDGQPDLQGVWDYRSVTPLERPGNLAGTQVFTSEEAAQFEEREVKRRDDSENFGSNFVHPVWWLDYGRKITTNRTSLIVDPPDGRIPQPTPEGQKRTAATLAARQRAAAGPEDRSLWERCITRALPRLPGPYNNNIQIVQAREYVAIVNEMIHESRIIPLDGRPRLGQNIRQWLGDSRGRWEGDLLVIDTANFDQKADFMGASVNLHLVERLTRVDRDTMTYDVRIEDATSFTRPWTVAIPMVKSPELIYEYECHEGNRGLRGILAGARAQEKAAEEAVKKGSK